METYAEVLDVRGKACPLPVFEIYRRLKQISPGNTVCVLTSDPGSQRNFRAFCRRSGDEFVDARPQEQAFAVFIRKGQRPL